MYFELCGPLREVVVIALGRGIRSLPAIVRRHGTGSWRKLKGRALVRLANGNVRLAEVHWYEAHGIGKRDLKIKTFLDEKS